MKKKNILGMLAVFAASASVFFAVDAAAQTDQIIYEATITNGTNIYGLAEQMSFENVKIDFAVGTISITNPMGYAPNGVTAYAVPQNGESFRFSYIMNPNDGRVSVAINGEIEASGICGNCIGKRSVGSISNNQLVLENCGRITPVNQAAQLVSCDTASVEFRVENPIQYAELSNLRVVSADGTESVGIVDCIKDNKHITLKFAEELEQGKAYIVQGTSIPDIYGGTGNIMLHFTPAAAGMPVRGEDVKLTDKVKRAWGFEQRIDWHTQPKLTKNFGWRIDQTVIGANQSTAFYDGLYKMPVTAEHHTEGDYALKWDEHNYYSTLATESVARDWTGSNMFNLSIWSQSATGETVNVLIYSDNPATPWKDGYTYPIVIDWTGEKQFNIPLSDFKRFENPVGFDNVSAIYFTTKIFNGEPNPYTVLYMDDMNVTYSPDYPITPMPGARLEDENQHRDLKFDEAKLNHNYPEVKRNQPTPFAYEAYYKTERALYGYFPKYHPGVASFDRDGKMYIRADGTHIQYLENGEWQVIDLTPVIRAAAPTTQKIYDVAYEDKVIRFDNDGWAYVLVNADARTYLCWSSDGMQTWSVRRLDGFIAQSMGRFEHIDGGNVEAMNRPPVIILNRPSWGEKDGYLIIPKKTPDGGLDFDKVKFADSCISSAAHTGDGNFVVTHGNMAYIVYGIYNYASLDNPIEQIPAEHEAWNLSYERERTLYYRNGVPTFIRTVNMTTLELSDPVFVGFAGVENDDHNWPGIALDSDGYIHVIMNGHHDPFCYTRSTNPYDISSWTPIEQVGTYNSYGALMVDQHDKVYVMTRDASRGYRFDTSVVSRNNDGTWSKTYVLQRKAPYYEVARQRMTYNPVDDEIYIHYYSQSDYFEVFRDEYEGVLFTWPNEERSMLYTTINGAYGTIPQGTDAIHDTARRKCYWQLTDVAVGREGVLVKSTDGANSFRLVQTDDCR